MQMEKPPIPHSVEFVNRTGVKVVCDRVKSFVIVKNIFKDERTAKKIFENTINKFMRGGWELTKVNGQLMKMGKIVVAKGLNQALSPKIKEKHSNIKLPKEGS